MAIAALAITAAPLTADEIPAVPASTPKLKIHDPRYDWGEVFQGESARHSFVVENVGTADLRIIQVKPGCSCSVSDNKYKKVLKPGEQTRVSLQIDTTKMKKPQKYTKSATITTNDPKQPQTKVHMSGMVARILDWSPASVRLATLVGSGATGEFEVSIPESDHKIEIEELKPQRKIVTIEGHEELEPGKKWKVFLSADAFNEPSSKRDSLVARVKINDKKRLNVIIPVSVVYQDRITVKPRGTITFRKSETSKLHAGSTDAVMRDVVVSSGDSGLQFQVTNVELLNVPPGMFETSVTETKSGTEYKVSLALKQYVAQRFVRGKIRIHTNDPSSPPKELSIFARFDPKLGTEAGK